MDDKLKGPGATDEEVSHAPSDLTFTERCDANAEEAFEAVSRIQSRAADVLDDLV